MSIVETSRRVFALIAQQLRALKKTAASAKAAAPSPITELGIEITHLETLGPDLLIRVRAGFVGRGTTLNAWCLANDVHHSNARQVLLGAWDGPAGRRLRTKILRAAGLTTKPDMAPLTGNAEVSP